jgi:hypothetical protein
MNLRTRIARLARAAADRPPADALDLVVCHAAARDRTRRPVGVYRNPAGNVAEYVHPGDEPDPAVLEPLAARLVPWGAVLMCESEPD